ncbi:RsmB/NOP family class I SAM-dependent RNA methyltransferase [Actinospica sp.]|jgi:16S rRNA (cytosine967-C5)-methyltransferase|uniref:RsmB/NOP family class I SAM-dependent RNA methyltransferase n=1 Tax=Actinospica sp. TaxID=1872142 RepID=UPI002C5E3B15|nr:transcription antitermination factor NusB [Actinospica sp.]HWG27076.1 transcription antitermination factor NusB [Actinospica sp.]
MATYDPARRTAYDTLRAVSGRDAYANLVLPGLLAERRVDARDAALATELAYGTLRAQGTYDAILSECVDRPLGQLDPELLDVLRLGAHQLLATRIPPHAAVAATVDLAREVLHEGAARMCNAVLRRVGQLGFDEWIERIAPNASDDPEGYLALYRAHPRWIVSALWDSLAAHRGSKVAHDEIDDLLKADNERPGVTLVARPGLATIEDLLDEGAEPGRYAPTAAYLPHGDPGRLETVRRGRAGVQDEGSQLVALAVAEVPLDGDDELWLDLCAGPGGKAALLAATVAGRGGRLVAVELAPHRARLVKRALQPIPGLHKVITADGNQPAWRAGLFDRVIADVPCTGLGALRRRPESRWRRAATDVALLAETQKKLLGAALDSARPGGIVGYVTCSPHLAETRIVVQDVLRARDDVRQIDARPYLPGVPELGDGPDVQLWPHVHNTDAMYLALLQRTEEE